MYYLFMALIIFDQSLSALIVGSKSSASTQSFTIFPSADSNNTMLGFASFENGFMLEDKTTSCTFDDFIGISGIINLNQGRLTLRQDFCLVNEMSFLSGGIIEGNNHAIKFPQQLTTLQLPLVPCRIFTHITDIDLESDSLSDLRSVDWAQGDEYLATGQRSVSGKELKVFYFDGSSLTLTADAEQGREVTSVRWHPSLSYIATGLSSASGDDVAVYFHNVSNGTLTKTDGDGLSSSANAVAWHPSGSYLIVGTSNDSHELIKYSFSAGTLSGRANTNLSSNQNVNREALSFNAGGDKLAVGLTNNSGTNVSEILVYDFNGSLTLTTSLDTNDNVQVVDWSPTGTYIAAGLTGSSTNIRIYSMATGVLREVETAQQSESRGVYSVHWHPSGNYVAFGINTGSNNELRIFYFDRDNELLTETFGINSPDEIWATRWSNDGNAIAYGFEDSGFDNRLDIAGFVAEDCPLILDNTTVVCNSNVDFLSSVHIKGVCKINGQGKQVRFTHTNELLVRPHAHLILENIEINEVKDSNIRCMNDTGKVTLRNCELCFERDFTFSHGSLYFDEDVMFTGTSTFNYTTKLASTIASDATLYLNTGHIFNYAPAIAQENLLYMTDATSRLFLDGCSLHSTSTGLQLSDGILVIDNDVTLSSAATVPAEGIALQSSLDIQVRGGAVLDLHGYITYE
jgi:WD40 repeat protein